MSDFLAIFCAFRFGLFFSRTLFPLRITEVHDGWRALEEIDLLFLENSKTRSMHAFQEKENVSIDANLGETEHIESFVCEFHFFDIIDTIDGEHSLGNVEVLRWIILDQAVLYTKIQQWCVFFSMDTYCDTQEMRLNRAGRRCGNCAQLENRSMVSVRLWKNGFDITWLLKGRNGKGESWEILHDQRRVLLERWHATSPTDTLRYRHQRFCRHYRSEYGWIYPGEKERGVFHWCTDDIGTWTAVCSPDGTSMVTYESRWIVVTSCLGITISFQDGIWAEVKTMKWSSSGVNLDLLADTIWSSSVIVF